MSIKRERLVRHYIEIIGIKLGARMKFVFECCEIEH